ncbi:XRE family transcriptional regulator [Streptomyces cellostaticus]|uniref:XRE family transcriptional regulator n=1 Tax=Streptomyces cellostaticus TaxID=67285 RepID=A0A101NIK6_9ACTN|nr:helix-turn-helix domain-containing protein [Streptomyces cellostaticus]KUM93956.1 XRE family transcriptional regulator [Streptomyces cellostaticus]GHI04990.1 transcriptional regulator [Streptomyces cellostaticus]
MSNERLRSALLARGMTVQDLAEEIGVIPKTVERWITKGKVPYRRHQYATAAALKMDVTTLWDDGRTVDSATDMAKAEIGTVYPHRHTVPSGLWRELYSRAQKTLDVLVYSGLFLSEDPLFHDLLKAKVAAGVQVRILLGDPDCAAVRQRGIDEGHQIMDGKIRNALHLYRPLMRSHPDIGFRLHDSTLYNSIYRADDEMLVNPHVYGIGAYLAPVLHLRRLGAGGVFDTYANSIEHTWENARPVGEADVATITGA